MLHDCEGFSFILEGDEQKIVKICSKERCHEVLILTYMIVLLRCFQNVLFNFVSRTCDRVAHLIAKSAISSSSPLAWVGDFPGWAMRKASLDVPV